MNKIFFAILFIGSLHASGQNAEQTKVNQSLVKLFDALAALDIDGIKAFSAKDLMVLESGVVWNLDTLAQKVDNLKGTSFSRTNHLDFIRTEINGNSAWVAYYNTADMIVNGEEIHKKWLESALLVKEDKTWKIKLLHSTTLKKQE